MMYMQTKKEAAKIVLKAVEKVRDAIIEQQVKEYYKPLKQKEWHDLAVQYTIAFEKALDEFFQKQKKAYSELFKNAKVIYISTPKVVQKAKYRTEEYLDKRYNHVVVKDIRDILLDMEKQFENELDKLYEKQINSGLIRSAGETVITSMGLEFDFNQFEKFTKDYLQDKKIHWGRQVQGTTEATIKNLLVEGYEKGHGSYEVAASMQKLPGFSFIRAEMVARTEVISACNYSDLAAWQMNPDIIGKQWDNSGDKRVRPTHRAAGGQKRKLDEPFSVGGSRLMHPADGSLGATSKEVISCRCTMYPVFKDEDMKSNTVYDDKDTGTDDWLRRQDKEFQEEYLGGKGKHSLFRSGLLDKDEFLKPFAEIKEDKISNTIKHSRKMPISNRNKFEIYIADILNSGLSKGVEYAIAMDLFTGNKIHKKISSNEEGKIEIPKEMMDKINIKPDNSVILIHNHPNGTPPSKDDIILLSEHKSIKSIIAVGHNTSFYSIEVLNKKWYDLSIQDKEKLALSLTSEAVKSLVDRHPNIMHFSTKDKNRLFAKELEAIYQKYGLKTIKWE